MESFVKRTVRCPVCGQETEIRVLRGMYQTTQPDLDGDAHNPDLFETVQICAHCGYAADSLQAEPPQGAAALVRSEAYQAVLRDAAMSAVEKKLRLAALVDDCAGDAGSAAHHRMMLVWHLRAQQAPKETVRRALAEAIARFEIYLKDHADAEAACVLIDCLRRSGDFAGAEETAESLAPYVAGTPLAAVVALERRLIAARDAAAHRLSEVQP